MATATATATTTATEKSSEVIGTVLEVVAELLSFGRTQEVLDVVAVLVARNEQLERQLAALGRRTMKANEGVSSAQLVLLLGGLSEQHNAEDQADPAFATKKADEELRKLAEAAAEKARQRKLAEKDKPKHKPRKKPLPAELPRREHIIEVPKHERDCPCCGEERLVFGYEVSETLELTPAKIHVRRDMREQRVCKTETCDRPLVIAPRGDKIVAGGQLGCSVAAEIVCNKYELGLPLHRQVKIFKRMGIMLPVSTLCDQVKWTAELLRPLWILAVEQVGESNVKHLDGTGLAVLDRDHSKGKRTGTLWGMVGAESTIPKVAAYLYSSTKKAVGQVPGELGPSEILAGWSGKVVLDADVLFSGQRKRDDLIDCGCNMHARRYFVKALDSGDKRAALVLGAFKALYQVERDVRDASDAERVAARREQSTPIYDKIVKWCEAYIPDTPPKSGLGKAIRYLLKHQLSLRRFESDGSLPIDNVAAEHNFISVALTRKNFLFAGSEAGAQRAAIIYTILRCCRLAGVEPIEYLTAVLPVLSRKIKRVDMVKLMPAAWAESRRPNGLLGAAARLDPSVE